MTEATRVTPPSAHEEPIHPLVEALYKVLVPTKRTLTKSEFDEVLASIGQVPDAELALVVDSLERLAGFCHEHLEATLLASQLLDLLVDSTPFLLAAGERLKAKKADQSKATRQRFDALTGTKDAGQARAPALATTKPKLSVNDLRPRTKFQ